MKRLLSIVMIGVLVLCMAPAVFASGTAFISGPEIVRAGDTITVSFSAGGGIYGGSGSLSYDPALLTLQSCNAAIGGSWAVEFSGDQFVFYDNSMASPISNAVIFTATFQVNSNLAAGTGISVTAGNVILSDGKQDFVIGSCTYSAVIAMPLSDNCRLSSLTVNNAAITPNFAPDVLEYSASVPFEVSALSLAAVAEHPNATVSIENPGLAVAATTAVMIKVTAENGNVRNYVIYVTRAQDPSYVPSSNTNLKALSVEGYQISPAFSADVAQYYVWLPYETQSIIISAETEDSRAKADVSELPELIPGKGTDIPVTVTAEDGTQKIYTVTAVRAPAHQDTDQFLNGGFEPETEPTGEPEVEPTVEPEIPATTHDTEPAPEETVTSPEEQQEGITLPVMILAHLACAFMGAAIGAVVTVSVQKKKGSRE